MQTFKHFKNPAMIKIGNLFVENCGVGISAAHDSKIEVNSYEAINTKTALEVRDPPSIAQALGLPASTPPEVIIEALQILHSVRTQSLDEQKLALKGSRLAAMLGIGADIATLIPVLLSFL